MLEQVAWLPLCGGLTLLGLVASWITFRRRGVGAGLRLASWSLLPLAAYLTQIIPLLGDIVGSITQWAVGLVISPVVWAGIALAGVAVVGFVVSGALRRRDATRRATGASDQERQRVPDGHASKGELGPQKSAQQSGASSSSTADDEDFSDIEEILRRRGIT